MADARATCSADSFCGGVVSRGCNENNTVCTDFLTRSGWPSDCHAGVPCDPTSTKDVTPGWKALQNSYLITNAGQCGHGPKTPGPPSSNGIQGHTHAKAVYSTMTAVDQEATWVYQAWPWMRSFMETKSGYPSEEGANYMRNFTSAVPKGKLVMLDMRAECIPIYYRTDSFYNTTFIFEVMDDFGGTNGMFGDIGLVNELIALAANSSTNERTGAARTLGGTGISMEGIDQNPAYYEAVLHSLWHQTTTPTQGPAQSLRPPQSMSGAPLLPAGGGGAAHRGVASKTWVASKTSAALSTKEYLEGWGAQRCGKPLPDVKQAWAILSNTTYRRGVGVGLGHRYCSNANPGNKGWANLGNGWSSSFWRGGYNKDSDVAAYASQLFEAWVRMEDTSLPA